MHQDRVYSEEAAGMLGRTVSAIRNWRSKGTGPPYYSDGYRVFYLRHEVEAYLDAQVNPQT